MTAHVITVRPHANLWIINKVVGVGDEIIKIVLSGSVLCLRDGYTLMRKVGASPNHELRKNPAPGQDVVRNRRVTIVMSGTISAERLKQRIASNRTEKQGARRFIENSQTGIVPLHVLFRTDAAVCIRRVARRVKCAKPNPDTIKTQACSGRR